MNWCRWAGVVSLAFVCVLRAEEARFARDDALIERVVELMDRRLAIMPEVAAIKYRQHKAIADPAREREVIEQSVAEARGLQLEPEAARELFTLQIAMARAVQEERFARWRAGAEEPGPARDLVKDLRPALDALGRELLPAIYLASPSMTEIPEANLERKLARLKRQGGIADDATTELARALHGLRITATPTWATVQRVKVLRVGMTGDYAPFSEERDGALQGSDVEMTQALARSWGVAVMFLRTSWPTLMSDLAKRRFDLVASGVSITEERRREAEFSAPYRFDGKMPIARRENATKFSTLEGIDHPGVRVIVNPGGTNERFVRERLKRATILVHPDNRTIFDELVAGRADVMITDESEVRLQEQRHPELTGTMRAPLTRASKGVMLPKGSELTAKVDAWLAGRKE